MNKPIKPQDNQANIPNPNKGTPGTNRQYDQNQGNRGAQLNQIPNAANQYQPPAPQKSRK
jgi:hypothetical protein